MSGTSLKLLTKIRGFLSVIFVLVFVGSCTGIINVPESDTVIKLSVKARKKVYSQSDIDLIYKDKPKDVSAYCILENSKNKDNCYWVKGSLPSKFVSETGEGRKVLTIWVKDKKNVVSDAYTMPVFTIDSTPPVWTSSGLSHAATYSSLSQTPPITFSKTATDALTSVRYQYAIGTANTLSNRADLKNWTDLGSSMPFQISGLALTNGSTYYVSLRAVDEANNISTVYTSSGWLASVVSVSDPSFVSITPNSPSSNSSPVIVGTVGTDVQTVNLYSDASCTVSLGSGTRADFVGAGISLTMPTNPASATSIYGQGQDSNSDLSNCVLLTAYKHDNVAPTVSRVYSNSAAGNYNGGDIIDIRVEFSEAVSIVGTPTIELETGTTDTVLNYLSQPSANTLLFSYTVATGHLSSDLNYVATTSLTVGTSIKDSAGNDATLTLPGLATANSLAGQEALVIDGVVPAAPGIALQSPATSPGTDSTPTFTIDLSGGVNFLSTDIITLHEGADCSASAVATLTSETGTSALITRASAMSQTTTNFRVKVTDAAGNSTCSTSNGSVGLRVATYQYDNTAPAAPSIVLDSPATSPGTDSTPTFTIALTGAVNFAASDVITLHEGADCSAAAVATLTSETGTSALITRGSAMSEGSTDFRVKVTDAAGNSTCSTSHATAGSRVATYVYDNTAPVAPSIALQSPASSPGNDSTPTFTIALTGAVNFAASDVITLHEGADCSAAAVATLTSETGTSALITRGSAMSEGSTDFRVKVTDAAGNSTCSTSHATAGLRVATYRYDNTAPTWSDTLSHAATNNSTTQTPSITFTADAADTGGSGIQKYQYSIGTSSGGTQVVTWTDLAGGASPTSPFQVSSLTLSSGTTYYINMRVMDNVGLVSTVYSSDWVVAAVPSISYASSTGTSSAIGNAMTVTPSTLNNNGSAITNCVATPALPAWATLNTTTCEITGTPNASLSATQYSIVATNAAGDSSAATVTLRVDPLPTGAITIATGATHTIVNPVLLDLVGNYATQMYVTNTADCSAGGTWETLSAIKTWTLGQTNATATVGVKFRNSFGDQSPCYTDTIVHDDTAPAAPSFASFDPASPSSSATPKVIGTASADTAYVQLYKDSSCTMSAGFGTKAAFEGAGITAEILYGSTQDIYTHSIDSAGNSSACTLLGTYTNNGTQTADSWQLSNIPNNVAPLPRGAHTGVWTGDRMIVWGGVSYGWDIEFNTGGIYNPQTDTWKSTSVTNAPAIRMFHTAVWTGSKMIVWGGAGGVGSYADGGIYDPITDSWASMSNTSAQGPRAYHTAVWTGSKMIIWGGDNGSGSDVNTSSSYDPNTDTWTVLSNTNAPPAESYSDAVWTGSKMFIWSGTATKSRLYDPNTDTWTSIAITGAPTGGYGGNTVWTGSKIIVWGGDAAGSGIYDPIANTWSTMSSTNAPSDRYEHKVVWMGSKLYVFGGEQLSPSVITNTGGIYDPATDSWTATSTTGAPSGDQFVYTSVVWTGSKIIVWGGTDWTTTSNQGGIYDPVADTWTLTNTNDATTIGHAVNTWIGDKVLSLSNSVATKYVSAPSEQLSAISHPGFSDFLYESMMVWTGSQLFVWGGGDSYLNTGAIYDPVTDAWTSVSATNAPSGRKGHHTVWTGSKIIVWGGATAFTVYTNTGALYDPVANTWVTMSTTNAPSARQAHSLVWTGSKMLVWGGLASGTSTRLNTGAVYDPALNTWVTMSTTSAPTARGSHGAVWTGTDMIVWGGYTGSYTNTGGRYNLAGNSWSATTTTGAPTANNPTISLWTGSRMLNLYVDTSTGVSSGGMYDPLLNAWVAAPSTTFNSDARYYVWTGTDLIFWGGRGKAAPYLNGSPLGKRFNVHTNTWTDTSLVNTPEPRYQASNHIWTGSKMIVLGGTTLYGDGNPQDIGVYYPGPVVPAPSIVLSSPATSPGSDATPTFEVALTGGGNFDAGDVITLHEGSDCLGASVASVMGETGATALITRSSGMTNGTSANFRVKVTNSAGIANCSVTHATSGLQVATYAYDNTPPPAPSIVLNSPASSPGTDATPTFQIALTGGGNFLSTDVITLHEGADCSAAAVATLTSQTGTSALITRSSDMSEVTTNFRVKVTDAASNATCSTSHATAGLRVATYQYDNTAPTWANSVSHAATHSVASETPNISFTADAADTGGSGIQKYQYSLGTTSGGTEVRTWTDLAGGASPTSPYQATGLSLVASTTYYLNMRVLDNAGLSSTVHTSSWTVASVPTLSYAGATGTVSAIGNAMTVTPTTLNDNGSAVTNCVATPALPAWATLDTTTCVISGTPNASLAITTYSIVASNANGDSAAATVTLRVDPLPTGSISIATGASHTTVNPVILNLVGNYATEMYVTNTADCSAGGAWEALSSIKNWTLAQTNATATVAVKYKNSFGDESACYTDTIVHDNTAPTNPVFVSFDPASPSSNVTPKVIGTSSADTTYIRVFKDSACLQEVGRGTKAAFEGAGVTFNSVYGSTLSYYVAAQDSAGNFGACTLMDTYATTDSAAGDSWQLTTFEHGDVPFGRTEHLVVWTGSKMIVWGGWGYDSFGLGDGGLYDPVTDSWTSMSDENAPSLRYYATFIWTGSKMIVWGGTDDSGTELNTGGIYDPILDLWTPTTTSGAPVGRSTPESIWTGSKMIVWAGRDSSNAYLNTGGLYDPTLDTWTSMTTTNAPTGRSDPGIVWTGSKMLVWGGYVSGGRTNTGGLYDPATDTWVAMSTTAAPGPRGSHTMVWTGSKAIVWGGYNGVGFSSLDNGGIYDPNSNSWSAISNTGSPEGRDYHSAIWTGTKMIVYGGYGSVNSYSNTGGVYDPVTDTWTATTTTNAPTQQQAPGHSNIWTGSKMIIWGGEDGSHPTNRGAAYDPVADTWTATNAKSTYSREGQSLVWAGDRAISWGGKDSAYEAIGLGHSIVNNSSTEISTTGAPSGRYQHSVVWTGSKMIIWGGRINTVAGYNTGAVYDPVSDSWTAVTTTGAPVARAEHSAVWTGTEMIIWGGLNTSNVAVNTGGRYNPATDTWVATTTTGAPSARHGHGAVWTGSVMIVWSTGTSYSNTGGRYDPVANTWSATTTTGAPTARQDASVVWTGSKMLVWGGEVSGGKTNTGSLYDPVANSWSAMTTTNAPVARSDQTHVWTGQEFIVWGGRNATYDALNTGARYNVTNNTWTATTTTNAPSARYYHSAVWTGKTMLVVAGQNDEEQAQKVIGIYSPTALPAAPSIVLSSPASSPGSDSTPTFEVALTGGGNFAATDTITLHEGANCSGTAVATITGETGTTALITRSSAMADESTADFRVRVMNSAGVVNCSTSHATPALRVATYNYDTTPPPTISYAGATGTSGSRGTAMSITPTTLTTGAGATITNCAITAGGSLPTGLSIDTGTCVISGTPTTLISSNTFTVTVTNSFALTATADVSITVVDQWSDSTNGSVGFASATKTGVAWSTNKMILAADTDCDGNMSEGETVYVNCTELDSSWTPQWASLAGYWKFNEASWNGTAGEVLDSKGTGHGTSANGADTSTTTKVGRASGNFDGSNDYVSIPLDLSSTNKITVSFWLNWTSFANDNDLALEFTPDTNASTGGFLINPNGGAPTAGSFQVSHKGDVGWAVSYFTRPAATVWNHYVFVFDKSRASSEISAWVNGVPQSVSFQTNDNNTSNFANSTLYLMSRGGTSLYGAGKIDDLAVWTTVLTQEEIQSIYKMQTPSFTGKMISRVFDAGSVNVWSGFKWLSTLPFGKELPGDADNSGTISAADSETSTEYSALATDTLMDDLVGLWHLNESSATGGAANDFSDSSGLANHGEQSGTITFGAPSILSFAPFFDGDDDYISVADSPDLSITGALTLSAWVKSGPLVGNDGGIISKGSNANKYFGLAADKSYELGILDNTIYFQISDGVTNDVASGSYSALTDNKWHHVAATWSGSAGVNQMKIYFDGTLKYQANATISSIQDLGSVLDIGGYTTSWNFKGNIDEVGIWTRALDATEIWQLHQRGNNQTKFQVRACTSSTCADEPSWEGPDGTSKTFFSEIHNNTSINASGDPTGRVKVNFSDLVYFDFSSVSIPDTQYFQYRAILEAEGLCDTDADGAIDDFCSPDIKSVEVVP